MTKISSDLFFPEKVWKLGEKLFWKGNGNEHRKMKNGPKRGILFSVKLAGNNKL